MDIRDFVELAQEYSMGRAITEQLDAVLEGGRNTRPEAINSNALEGYILPFLQRAEEFGIDTADVQETVQYLIDGGAEDEDA